MRIIEQANQQFRSCFGVEPHCSAYAAGRVTVIGGHTDYNGGLVVSAALPVGTAVSVRATQNHTLRIISNREPEPVELWLPELRPQEHVLLTRYVTGMLLELNCADQGMDISIYSDVPMRRGLASSAALTVSVGLAALKLFGRNIPPLNLVKLCQRAEREHVGVQCGLLDPYTALYGTGGKMLLIDCANGTHQSTALPSDVALVVCDSGVDRQLAKSQYNLRRNECKQVADAMGRPNLGEATLDDLQRVRAQLPVATQRAEHVIREIARAAEFWSALADRDYPTVKSLMSASHQSCRDLFECSHSTVDAIVGRALSHPGCVGARMTGGGWGGATVNLVHRDRLQDFCRHMACCSQVVKR